MEAKNNNLPISPHLQIYKPQITSMLSILHRISGVITYLGLMLLIWYIIVNYNTASDSLNYYSKFILYTGSLMNNYLGYSLLYVWVLCIYYHLCNGIRFLLLDAGKGFRIKQIYLSGYIVLILSFILSSLTFLCLFI